MGVSRVFHFPPTRKKQAIFSAHAENGVDMMGNLLVNTDTGEIITEVNPGDRILRGRSVAYLADVQDWRIEHFYKGNIDELRAQLLALSVNEKAFLMSVVTYVGYTDCCLTYDHGNTLDAADLLRLTGMGKSVLYATIDSLRRKDILYKGRNSAGAQYFVNPWLFVKGNRINKVLKTMFSNYKVRVCGGQKWGDMD
jgi:hypothetical protein